MKIWNVSVIFAAALVLVFLAGGCSQPMKVDGGISGRVTDSSSGAPIDSAMIYVAFVGGPLVVRPHLAELTDVDGWYLFLVSRTGIYIVEARKDGYLASEPRLVRDTAGEVDFVLVPAEVSQMADVERQLFFPSATTRTPVSSI